MESDRQRDEQSGSETPEMMDLAVDAGRKRSLFLWPVIVFLEDTWLTNSQIYRWADTDPLLVWPLF
jgi:hypothetical protein